MKYEVDNKFSFLQNDGRTHKIINSLQVGVLIQGPRSEILFSNKAALNMLGLTEDELYGRSSFHPEWNVIHEDGSLFQGPAHPVPTAITTKRSVTNVIMGVYRPVTKDRVWLLVNAEPLLDDKGEIKEVVCSFSDITKHKAVEEKLTWLYQSLEIRAFELATSNAELERFAYVATHDLQEPLRLVSSFMQLLKKKYAKQLDEQATEYIDYAVGGANRIKKLILDLLEFSKVSSNREEFTPTDMNMVLQDVSLVFSGELKDTGAELIIPTLPTINANTALMLQLFENLVGNALKYRDGLKPLIQIDCKEKDDEFRFSVTDNGIGIDPEYSDKIFILFQRLHNDNETYEGTGVGLAICKKIVELHQGTIWVVSEKGKGSTFYFTIPKAQNQAYEKL
ncbi:MAG TPA: ATP-binding protein [Chitinophagaceae bacterium]|nr:ATP-binding protein [Chitinophagaceae bacterium]